MSIETKYTNANIKKILKNYFILKQGCKQSLNTDITCILMDIDNSLKQVNMTDKQLMAINYYKLGYTESEIGNLMGNISHQAVNKLIKSAIKKILKYLNQ